MVIQNAICMLATIRMPHTVLGTRRPETG